LKKRRVFLATDLTRELENLELDARAFERVSEWSRRQQEADDPYEQ